MDNKSMTLLIGAFVALIIGVALISTIAGGITDVTKTRRVANETLSLISIANPSGILNTNFTIGDLTSTQSDDDFIAASCITYIYNGTTAADDALELDTDYEIDCGDNTFFFLNTTAVTAVITHDNNTMICYEYENSDYIKQGWARTSLDIVPGFFAIALLLIAVGLFYAVAKKEGII